MKPQIIIQKKTLHVINSKLYELIFFLFLCNTSSFAQTTTTNKVSILPKQGDFIMCEVMPKAEVASKAPFTIPLISVETWPTKASKTGCAYAFKSAEDQAGLSISLTNMGTPKNALISYKNAYQASEDLWEETPTRVIALKDTGFFSGKDECGLKFHLGKYLLDINFKGQFGTVTTVQRKESGILLAEMIIKKLKYLWQIK